VKVLSGPENVCRCGHVKNFHAYIRTKDSPPGSPLVVFDACGATGCTCEMYVEEPSLALAY